MSAALCAGSLLQQRSRRRPKVSSFQAAVLWELRGMGYEARMEYPIGESPAW